MSYYIIIRGPLGIGKSTISKRLSELLHAEYISMDSVLSEHGLDKRGNEPCIPAKNFITADEIVLPTVKKILEEGRIVIFDGCFYHKEQIEHLIDQLPNEHYVFNLKASLKTCIKRDSHRKKVYGAGAATAVYNLVSKFNYGVDIDLENKSVQQSVEEILSLLKK